jgi:hypothetical protein
MKEFFTLLAQHNVTPNGLYVLYGIKQKFMFAEYVNVFTERRRLALSGHLVEKKGDCQNPLASGVTYTLTEKGLHLIRDTEDLLGRLKKMKKSQVPLADWTENIAAFVSYWPTGTQGGQVFRTHPKDLKDRFVWFFTNYPEYSWEEVLAAAEIYVDRMLENDYKYLVVAKNFIKRTDLHRQTTSMLADYCRGTRTGDLEKLSNGIGYFPEEVV